MRFYPKRARPDREIERELRSWDEKGEAAASLRSVYVRRWRRTTEDLNEAGRDAWRMSLLYVDRGGF